MRVDRPAGLVTVSFPPEVTDAASASKEIVAAVEKLVNGKFKVQDVEWRGEIRRRSYSANLHFVVVKCSAQLGKNQGWGRYFGNLSKIEIQIRLGIESSVSLRYIDTDT